MDPLTFVIFIIYFTGAIRILFSIDYMLFQNFITQEIIESPDNLIVRKTRYILIYILVLLIFSIILIILSIYVSLQVTSNSGISKLGMYLNSMFGVPILIGLIFLWIVIISMLFSYLYYAAIITKNTVVKIELGLLFKEEIKTVELYKVLSIASSQSSIFQSVLDYGDIRMEIQGSGEMLFKNMPRTKTITSKIEEMKLYTTEERY